MTKTATQFATSVNPFTGQAANQPKRRNYPATRGPSKEVDLSLLSIASDPVPTKKTLPVHKYDALFSSMQPGQCVVCPTEYVSKIEHALRAWIKRNGKDKELRPRRIERYDGGDTGRVWLLPVDSKKLKAVA